MLTTLGSGAEYIELGAKLIKAGEIVAFPTETVYGLGADAFNARAVFKIFEAKGRPADNPLIVHLYDYDQLKEIAEPTPLVEAMYNAFCPGPLTMVLKKKTNVPDIVTAGLDTVGVRFPSHPVARELLRLSTAVAAPSANASKHVSPTTAMHVMEDLGGKIPLIIDGGTAEGGIESTIIDLVGENPIILRPGMITKEMIDRVCSCSYYDKEIKTALAPGMKYLHYSPYCDCVVCSGVEEIIRLYDENTFAGRKSVILARDMTAEMLGSRNVLSLGANAGIAAKRLYGLLREGEKAYDLIIIENLGNEGGYYSVMNRISKAANRGSKR